MKLTKAEAVRLCESTVISRRVHMISVDKPEEVRILAADAGSAFYGRQEKGTIYHIDIFHQVGSIDHRAVARAILNAVQNYPVASGLLDRWISKQLQAAAVLLETYPTVAENQCGVLMPIMSIWQ